MSGPEVINGVQVSEGQIGAWMAEAEDGFDVAALKKRGRGRPGRGAEPSQVIALRLTTDEIASLDARANREGKSRSEVIRDALAQHESPPVGIETRDRSLGRDPGCDVVDLD